MLLAEPDTRAAAQAACRLLLVDEFQDLTPAHVLLIRLLSAPDLAVFGVGDDDQTIYGYTGASPDWLIGYAELFPGSGSHALEVNYRCPPAVVAGAERLLRHNRRRVDKVIRPRVIPPRPRPASRAPRARADGAGRPADGPAASPEGLAVVEAGTAAVAATVDAVAAALAAGAGPGDIAVLARVNASLAPVQVALAHRGIPVRPTVDAGWLERTGVRAALGWLRLAVQPRRLRAADVSDTARRPGRGLSARVVEWMAEQRDLDGLVRLSTRLRDRDGDKVAAYAADLQLLSGLVEAGSPTAALLTAVRDQIGLDEAMDLLDSSRQSVKGSAQGDDLDALVALAALHPDAAHLRGLVAGAAGATRRSGRRAALDGPRREGSRVAPRGRARGDRRPLPPPPRRWPRGGAAGLPCGDHPRRHRRHRRVRLDAVAVRGRAVRRCARRPAGAPAPGRLTRTDQWPVTAR